MPEIEEGYREGRFKIGDEIVWIGPPHDRCVPVVSFPYTVEGYDGDEFIKLVGFSSHPDENFMLLSEVRDA